MRFPLLLPPRSAGSGAAKGPGRHAPPHEGPARPAWMVLLAALVLCGLGEGGAVPQGLFLLHSALVAAIALALTSWWSESQGRGSARESHGGALPPGSVWLAAFLAVLLLSALRAPYGYAAALAVTDCVAAVAAFMLAGSLAAGAGRRVELAIVVLAAAVVQCGIAWWQWATFQGPGPNRPAGTLLNTNHLAAYLGCAALCGWGLLLRARDRRAKGETVCLVVALAVIHAAFLLPASRGALAGLAVGYLVLAGLLRRQAGRGLRKVLAGALAVVLLAGAVVLAARFRGEDPYRWDRVRIWRAAIHAGVDHPLLGVGPGQFAVEGPAHSPPHGDRPVRFGKRLDQTHSDLVRILVEGGLLGTAALVAGLSVVGLSIRRGLRGATWSAEGSDKAVAAGFAAGVSALVAQALLENISERPALLLTGAALAGAASALGARSTDKAMSPAAGPLEARERESSTRPGPSGMAVPLLAASGLAVVYFAAVVAPYLADVNWRRAGTGSGRGAARLERAMRLNPYQPAYHALAATVLTSRPGAGLSAHSFAEAVSRLEKARALDPREPGWALQEARLWRRAFTEIFKDRSSLDAALEAYSNAAALAPLDPFVPVEKATLLALAGERSAARSEIERSLALEPNLAGARLMSAKLRLESGDVDGAREAFDEACLRRAQAASYGPESPYEEAVLAWDETLSRELREAGLRPPSCEEEPGGERPRGTEARRPRRAALTGPRDPILPAGGSERGTGPRSSRAQEEPREA